MFIIFLNIDYWSLVDTNITSGWRDGENDYFNTAILFYCWFYPYLSQWYQKMYVLIDMYEICSRLKLFKATIMFTLSIFQYK